MARIFLSYAREDLAAAKTFSGALEQAGHEVWWDHHLRAGSRFSWDIDAALKGAEAVVVLWSKDSVESAWVQDEAAEGLEGSRLIPVTLDGSKPPLGFRQYHTIDLAGWRKGDTLFAELIAAIGAKACGDTPSSPPPRQEIAPQQPTICVVPFANKSGDPDQDYFSEGITEDVITDLSKISAVSVIGHNTSVGLHGAAIDLRELASQLGVTHVVEGTVRKAASRLRIMAQLVETANGRSLWAERYDRELSDVFAIQDEISHAIVEALQLTLLPGEKTAIAEGRTTSAEAYDLYLKARGLWPAGAGGDYRKSDEIVRLCTEAVAIDPQYANAWSLIALANSELRFWQNRPVDALMPAEKAIELDPGMPEPHCVRARHLEEQGKAQEAKDAIGEALSLDRDSWEANWVAAQMAFRGGDLGEAIGHFEKAVAVGRKDHASASMLVACFATTGDARGVHLAAEMAVAFAEGVVICDPSSGIAFASAARGFAALGEHDRARKWIHKALNVDPGNLAMRYSLAATTAAILNDDAEAVEILEPFAEAISLRSHVRLLEVDPAWARVRDRMEFDVMLQRARKRVEALSLSC